MTIKQMHWCAIIIFILFMSSLWTYGNYVLAPEKEVIDKWCADRGGVWVSIHGNNGRRICTKIKEIE